jgi:3-phytase
VAGVVRWRVLACVVALVTVTPAPAIAATQPVGDATATIETAPVVGTGDAADDPATWVHPTETASACASTG